jgi:death-on-curing family protein
VEYIHDALVMKLWAGSDPIEEGEYGDSKLIESAVSRRFQSAFCQDVHPTLIDKSVALFHSLIANHPFYNGNKRTAAIAFDHFLMANAHFSAADDMEMYALAERIAAFEERGLSQDESLAEIMEAVRENIISVSFFIDELGNNPRFVNLHGVLTDLGKILREHPRNVLLDPSS